MEAIRYVVVVSEWSSDRTDLKSCVDGVVQIRSGVWKLTSNLTQTSSQMQMRWCDISSHHHATLASTNIELYLLIA